MNTYIQIYRPNLTGTLAPKTGTDAVVPVDGRLSLHNQKQCAERYIKSLKNIYKETYRTFRYQIRKGDLHSYQILYSSWNNSIVLKAQKVKLYLPVYYIKKNIIITLDSRNRKKYAISIYLKKNDEHIRVYAGNCLRKLKKLAFAIYKALKIIDLDTLDYDNKKDRQSLIDLIQPLLGYYDD